MKLHFDWLFKLSRRELLSGIGILLVLGAMAPAQAQQTEISESALRQIESLQQEKNSRNPAQQKIDSQLLYTIRAAQGEPITQEVPTQQTDVVVDAKGAVLLDIDAKVSDSLLKFIDQQGGEVVASYPAYQRVRATLPLDKIETLAARKDVKFVQEAVRAETNGGNTSPRSLLQKARVDPSPLFQLRQQGLAQRKARLKEQLPSLLARAKSERSTSQTDPGPTPDVGLVTSEGDSAHQANVVRSTFNARGQGIKIGVLSDSYNSLGGAAADIANGDLPAAGVTVLTDLTNGSDEGRAMLQIVHDLAPDAQLFFASAFNGDVDFANQIRALRAQGSDIIVDDISYFNENPFQDGVITQAVNDVTAAGAIYLSSAGNSGSVAKNTSGTWEGNFKPATGATLPGVPASSTLHDFGTSTVSVLNTVASGGSSRRIDFFWSDPQGASSNDHDVYVLNAAGTAVLRSSTNIQNGTQNPIEQIGTLNVGERIAIARKAGAQDRFLHLETGRGRLSIFTNGRTRGHNAAGSGLSVAAVDAATAGGGAFVGGAANPVETFSSDGPRRIFYQPNGTPITPGNFLATGGQLLQKPDFTAADGVVTTLPPNSGLNPFFGTSAAAPHAAAIAGLIKSYNPSLSAGAISNLLRNTALDIESVGVDAVSGTGIVLATSAINSAPLPPTPTLANFTLTSGVVGTTVTITGTNFFGVTGVSFGGVAAPVFTVVSPTQITAVIPAGATTGPVSVTSPGGTATSASNFTVNPSPAPSISTVTPPSGLAGTPVTITGTGFTGTTSVTFNGVIAAFSVVSDTQINTTVPQGVSSGPLVVTTPGGSASRNFTVPPTTIIRFDSNTPLPLPDVTTVEAPLAVSGLTSPIAKVVVNFYATHTFDGDLTFVLVGPDNTTANLVVRRGGSGDNFGVAATPDSNRTNFDDSAAASITTGNPPFVGTFRPEQPLGTFVGKSGTAANGTWKLRIIDSAAADVGTLNNWSLLITTAGQEAGPITFSPESGPVRSSVVLTGTGFTGATGVTFNGVPAAFGVNSNTQITATVPDGATTGPVAVATPTGTLTSTTNFGVLAPPPVITSIGPGSGPVGTTVVITGSNFTGATAVRFFRNQAASFTVDSPTQITAVVPAGATTGTISITTPLA